MSKVPDQYRKMIEQIRIDAENFASSSMKDVYSLNKKTLDQLHIQIAKIYIKYAKDGYLNLTQQDKKQITSEVTNKLKNIGTSLGKAEVNTVSDILKSVFKTTYYKNAFVLENGMTSNIKFNILQQDFIDSAVNAKFKGSTFSDRIWHNKVAMIDKLKKSIVEAYKGNTTIDKIAKDIQHTFNVSAYESNRLVATETARVSVKAQEQIGLDSGCKEVMWSATLDSRTASHDASLDGKVWGINENHPEPVIDTHPRCRCVLINVPFVGWKPSKRKDNETKEIIDYKAYDKWVEEKGIINHENGDIIKGEIQYSNVKTVKEAESWAVTNLNLKKVSYKDISVDVANYVNKSMSEIYNEYPLLNGFVQEIKTEGKARATASAALSFKDAKLNTKLNLSKRDLSDLKSIDEMIGRCVDAKWWTPKDGVKGIIKHEMGHMIEYAMTLKKYGVINENGKLADLSKLNEGFGAIKKGEISKKIKVKALSNVNMLNTKRVMIDNLSEYGYSNTLEFLAEAVSEKDPRSLAKETVRLLKEKIKEVWK